MSRWGRTAILVIGALFILFGLLLQFRPDLAIELLGPLREPGAGPILLGAALVLSILFEGRYRRGSGGSAPLGQGWEPTGETFRDEESGQWLRVWFNPARGERRYLPADRKP